MAPSPPSIDLQTKPLLFAAATLLALLALTILFAERLIVRHIGAELEEIDAIQERHLETYLADAEFLEKSELSKPFLIYGENAGKRLNPLLYWSPSQRFGRKTPLVPTSSREFLLRYQDEWIKGRSFLERGHLQGDLELFQGLDRFQIWDLESDSPISDLVRQGELVEPSALPVPDTLDLISAVKLRLMKGSIDGHPLQALIETRQFANLLLTTENFQLVIAGLAVLDLERRAYRDFVDRSRITEAAWRPIDLNTTARANRAFNATLGYMRALTRADIFVKAIQMERLPPAFCAAVNERLPWEFALRDQLTGNWPFERNYRDGYRRLDSVVERAKKLCRVRLFTALYDEEEYESADPEAPWPLAGLPYFRTIFALRDLVSWPQGFDGYQRK